MGSEQIVIIKHPVKGDFVVAKQVNIDAADYLKEWASKDITDNPFKIDRLRRTCGRLDWKEEV